MISLALWGRSVSGCQKVLWKVPHHFFKLVSQFLNSFSHFSPTALALAPSAIVKVLGQNDMFVFWCSLQQMAFASQKVLWNVPQTILYMGLTVSCFFLGKWLLLQTRFCGGFCQLFFVFVSQMVVAKLLTRLTHTNPVRKKRPIMSDSCWGILWAYLGVHPWKALLCFPKLKHPFLILN